MHPNIEVAGESGAMHEVLPVDIDYLAEMLDRGVRLSLFDQTVLLLISAGA